MCFPRERKNELRERWETLPSIPASQLSNWWSAVSLALSAALSHSVWSLSNLFETRALGWIQRGLRQRWPVHGSAADKISAWSLAHSSARNSSSHGSCRWAMLSSGEGCNFLEGSQAGQSGDGENEPSPLAGCSSDGAAAGTPGRTAPKPELPLPFPGWVFAAAGFAQGFWKCLSLLWLPCTLAAWL